MKRVSQLFIILVTVVMISCQQKQKPVETAKTDYSKLVNKYAEFPLKSDLSHLTPKEKEILGIFFEISSIIDDMYWIQSFGDKTELLSKITDEQAKKFIMINYGPWDRLDDNKPFIEGYKAKPDGANFYPKDMTKEEFEKWNNPDKMSMYTMVVRNEKGELEAKWYKDYFSVQLKKVVELLQKAAELAENQGLKKYLLARADAFLTDKYFDSDMAWMDMKTSNIDFVVGPIENYEDKLFGTKTSYEAFILIKDLDWSKKLERFAKLLPALQKGLPVDAKYKSEMPGSDSDMNVYDAVSYAGDCNSGSKTIAINLPNDEEVHVKKGSRKLQLKNIMRAKFEKILLPISAQLIVEEQRKYVKFDAFFENVMFHEVAHGLGIKKTIKTKISVREALKEVYSPLEEAKADIMGLYLVTKLYEAKELSSGELLDNYVTFVAGIFRSVRFGSASAHGKANMMRFNYFMETGAIEKTKEGLYKVNFDKMKEAVISSVTQILILQGDGNYEGTVKLIDKDAVIKPELQKDLDKINSLDIPVDIIFKQGKSELGL